MARLVLVVLLLAAVVALVQQLPDIQRYLKMRSM